MFIRFTIMRFMQNFKAMRRTNFYFLVGIFFFVNFLSIGYSALNQTLKVTGDVSFYYNSKKLYDVLLVETRRGTLSEQYTGTHQDDYSGAGTKDIFYWHAANATEGTNIIDRNNVIFAGQCWQIIRTTDTGGVKMIYNGEAVSNQCLSTRDNHRGYSARISQNLASNYYYGTDYTYTASTGLFSLSGTREAVTWSAATGPAMVGRYTCLQSTTSGTCETLYLVESYQNATNGYVIPITVASPYSQFGSLAYNAGYTSPAYEGYMYNTVYANQSKTLDTTTYKYAANFTYSNGIYTLSGSSVSFAGSEASDIESLSTRHYTCWNTTGTCTTLSYVYSNVNSNLYYINLTGGKGISDAITTMMSASDVNAKNSVIKTAVDAWYAKYLNGYSSYLEDTVYCNDRSIKQLGSWDPNGGALAVAAANYFQFTGYSAHTNLSCANATDRFSISNSAAKLKYKVGLATAPEMSLFNHNNARVTGSTYRLMTPSYYGSSGYSSVARYINATGALAGYYVAGVSGVRPVISLTYGTEYASGTGTMADPYIVSTTAGTKQYVLNYNSNGGSTCSSNFVIKNANSTWGSLCTPTRTGYTFAGWNTRVDGSGTTITSSSTATYDVNVFAQWIDDIAPVVVSATASTTLDLANYVDFNATDAGTKIVGYNITTSTTAPTAWIPVVNAVDTDVETKYEYNAAWARVFHHNNHWGATYFSNANNSAEVKSSNTNDKYSVLDDLNNYKFSNKWEFLLEYPSISTTLYNRWTQTGNPVTTTVANGDGTENVPGYTAVHTDWTTNYWGGLALSTSSNTFIDGAVGHSNWYYAIGPYAAYRNGMPANSTVVSTANLWSRIDGLTNTTSDNLTRRIGGLKENKTYYVWVRDEAGNTAYKSVAVSKVDTTAPTATFTATNNVAASQTATITLGDNKAIDKYYFGTTNPSTTNITYTSVSGTTTSKTLTETISASGTYYVAVVDKAGNRTVINKTFYLTTLTPNRGTVSPTTVLTLSGNSFTIPNPGAVTGYTFNGWYKEASFTTSAGTSWTPTANATLYGKWTINDPATPTLSGGGTKVYNHEAMTLTCATSTNYASGTNKYYSFGYASTSTGEPDNWTTASTTNTVSVTKAEYLEIRYYSCKVYASDGTVTSATASTASAKSMSLVNARVYFDAATNGGAISGSQRLYVPYGKTNVYTGRVNTTAGTIPLGTKAGYTFNGWYTDSSDGTLVINSSKAVQASVTDWTNASKQWLRTSASNNDTTNVLYAQYSPNTYTISYTLNGGSNPSPKPTSGTYDSAVQIGNSAKTITITGNANGTGATVGSNTSKAQTFLGWTSTTVGSNAMIGTSNNPTTAWDGTTATKNTYFKNLVESGTVTLVANWTPVAVTLPTLSKTGYTCKWYTDASGGTEMGAGGASWTPSATSASAVTAYARCTIIDPATPTITGAATKVYNHEATTLTCATSTTYASDTSKYYSFGYSDTNGGTPDNWTAASTTATLSVAKNSYRGTRYYSCRVYASDGTLTSSTVASSTASDAAVAFVNARVYFDAATNSGTISGSQRLYVSYGVTSVYTERTGSTTGTIPTATRSGYRFKGWYTAASGGTMVINSSGTVQASVTDWTNASKQWLRTATANNDTTNVLYAQFEQGYTIKYTMRNGTKGTNAPTSSLLNSDVLISKPTKTITVTGDVNGSGATIGSAVSKAMTFAGWSSTTIGSNAKTGTAANPTTAWDGTKTTNTYFKRLTESGETVTMVANWSGSITLPTLSRSGYECRWYTAASGGTLMGAGGASWTPSNGSATAVTAYARCVQSIVWNYSYTKSYKTFTAPLTGSYKIELWGAQGMSGGKGAYVYGNISLTEGQVLYVYVGGREGWNGGGSSPSGNYGGDATDVRLTVGNLYSRIMVAGGGGSNGAGRTPNCDWPNFTCGPGIPGTGGLVNGTDATGGHQKIVWEDGEDHYDAVNGYAGTNPGGTLGPDLVMLGATGGTQTTGGTGAGSGAGGVTTAHVDGKSGSFGKGGNGVTLTAVTGTDFSSASSGAGGGGWFGGGSGSCGGAATGDYEVRAISGGGGGSSFIHGVSGYTRHASATYDATEYKFTSAGGTAGDRANNGYATITFLN